MKNKSKDRISNLITVVVLILIIFGISAYFYNDHMSVKKHMAECVEICKPDRALEIFSKKGCFCQKVEKEQTIDPKDTI